MKKLFLLSLLVAGSLCGFSQGTFKADEILLKNTLFLKNNRVDTIQKDTLFLNHVRSVPTSDAVYQFVTGRLANLGIGTSYGAAYGMRLNSGQFSVDSSVIVSQLRLMKLRDSLVTVYYTKTQLQTPGQAIVDWANIANPPTGFGNNFANADLTWTGDRSHNAANFSTTIQNSNSFFISSKVTANKQTDFSSNPNGFTANAYTTAGVYPNYSAKLDLLNNDGTARIVAKRMPNSSTTLQNNFQLWPDSTVFLSPIFRLRGIANTTASSIIYYNATTGEVTYGAPDGNNYPTALSSTGYNLDVARNGLSNLTVDLSTLPFKKGDDSTNAVSGYTTLWKLSKTIGDSIATVMRKPGWTANQVLFADNTGTVTQSSDLLWNGSQLTVGNAGFSGTNTLAINGGRGQLQASGSGWTFIVGSTNPYDPSKVYNFYNGSKNYLQIGSYNDGLLGHHYAKWQPGLEVIIDTLKGTGDRPVVADATGKLKAGTWPTGADGNNYVTAFSLDTDTLKMDRSGLSSFAVTLPYKRSADSTGTGGYVTGGNLANQLAGFYTKTNLQTSGQASVHWGNITNAPAFVSQNFANANLTASGSRVHSFSNLYDLTLDSVKFFTVSSDTAFAKTTYGFKYGNGIGGMISASAQGAFAGGWSNGGRIVASGRGSRAQGAQSLPGTSSFGPINSAILSTSSGTVAEGYTLAAGDTISSSSSASLARGTTFGGDIFATAASAWLNAYVWNQAAGADHSKDPRAIVSASAAFMNALVGGNAEYVSNAGPGAAMFVYAGDATTLASNDTITNSSAGTNAFIKAYAKASSKVTNSGFGANIFATSFTNSPTTNSGNYSTIFTQASNGGIVNNTGGNSFLAGTAPASGTLFQNTGSTSYLFGSNIQNYLNYQFLIGWDSTQFRVTRDSLFLGHLPNASGPYALNYDPATKSVSYAPSAGGADGNNYPTSFSASGINMTIGRNGLGSLTAPIDTFSVVTWPHLQKPVDSLGAIISAMTWDQTLANQGSTGITTARQVNFVNTTFTLLDSYNGDYGQFTLGVGNANLYGSNASGKGDITAGGTYTRIRAQNNANTQVAEVYLDPVNNTGRFIAQLNSAGSGYYIYKDSAVIKTNNLRFHGLTGAAITNATTAYTLYYDNTNGTVSYGAAPSGSGSGTVASGSQYQLAYYGATGTAVSGLAAITGGRALISDVNGLPTHSATTATEIGYLNGVTSAVQTQLNAKQNALSGTGIVASTAGTISYVTDNSANWNTAYGWGNHAGLYLPIGGGTVTGNTTFNTRVGIGVSPSYAFHVSPAAPAAQTSGTSGTNPTTYSVFIAGQNGGDINVATGNLLAGYGARIYVHAGTGGTASGTSGTGQGGDGGSAEFYAGDGGTGVTQGGKGGTATFSGGSGGFSGTGTSGAGGDLEIKGGNSGTAGNVSGGNVWLIGGNKAGTGSYGNIYLGALVGGQTRGNVRVGSNVPPTAMFHVSAGSATLPQFKLDAGTNLTTPQDGSMEYDGSNLFFTVGSTRKQLTGTTVGQNLLTAANPSAVTFPRINADNTVSFVDANTFRTAIGATDFTLRNSLTSGGVQTMWNVSASESVLRALKSANGNLTIAQQDDSTILFTASTGSFNVANSSGTTQFSVGASESIRFANGTNTTVAFDNATKTVTVSASGASVGNTTSDYLLFTDSTKGPRVTTPGGYVYELHVNDSGAVVTKLISSPGPSGPTGTALTFSTNGLNSWSAVSTGVYQTTSSTAAQADQTITSATDGGLMMQFTGTEQHPYMVLATTSSIFGSQYDAPGWFISIEKSGSTYFAQCGYGNVWTSTGTPDATNTLAVGDWVRIWRETSTGKFYAQKWNGTSWVTMYDLTAAAAVVSATIPTSTALLYCSMSTYTTITTKCSNPKKTN